MRYLFCLVNVRRFFAQRNSPFDMGDFSVLATSRRTQVRLRVAVLLKSPHLKRLRSARPLARTALATCFAGSASPRQIPSGSRYARRFPTKASLSSAHLGANKRRRRHYRHRSTGRFVAPRNTTLIHRSSPPSLPYAA